MKLKYCRFCGKSFTVSAPRFAAVYCSDRCRGNTVRCKAHERHRQTYKPRQPHEISCLKCGKTFVGRGNARYCINCLTDGSRYMTKLLHNRSEGVNGSDPV
ncbi:MAG TPA: hypothetical protein DDX71_00785 [Ruminococcus sp.]|nr:hypothetical protein [Ruminococcus sp.]